MSADLGVKATSEDAAKAAQGGPQSLPVEDLDEDDEPSLEDDGFSCVFSSPSSLFCSIDRKLENCESILCEPIKPAHSAPQITITDAAYR